MLLPIEMSDNLSFTVSLFPPRRPLPHMADVCTLRTIHSKPPLLRRIWESKQRTDLGVGNDDSVLLEAAISQWYGILSQVFVTAEL